MKKPIAVVTGAQHGFIGQHLVFTLEERGYKVIPLPHKLLSVPDKLDKFFLKNKPDYIFHLAAYGNMAHQNKEDEIIWGNYIKSYDLLKATKDIPYKAFVNVSSSSVLLPHQTLYSATKLGVEALCQAYTNEFDKPIVSCRLTSVYGPGEADFRLIPTIFKSCLKQTTMKLSLEPTHDYIYVSDVVEMLIRAAEKIQFVKGTSINCGTGVVTTNKQIADLIVNITGKPLDVQGEIKRKFDTQRWEVNVQEYNLIFGGAKVRLKEGLEQTYGYYKQRFKA